MLPTVEVIELSVQTTLPIFLPNTSTISFMIYAAVPLYFIPVGVIKINGCLGMSPFLYSDAEPTGHSAAGETIPQSTVEVVQLGQGAEAAALQPNSECDAHQQ